MNYYGNNYSNSSDSNNFMMVSLQAYGEAMKEVQAILSTVFASITRVFK